MNNTARLKPKLTYLENLLFSVFRKERVHRASINITLGLSIYTLFVLLLSGVEAAFQLSAAARKVVFFLYTITLLTTITYIILSYIISVNKNRFDSVKYSLQIGRFFPGIKDKLGNAISICKNTSIGVYSSENLAEANLEKVYKESKAVNFNAVIDFQKLRKYITVFFAMLFTTILLIVFVPALSKAFNRLINYNTEFKNTILNSPTEEEDGFIKKFYLSIKYPEYTKLPEKALEENKGDVVCLEGSTVNITVESVENLSHAAILYNGTETPLNISGMTATGEFRTDKDGEYYIILKNTEGKENLRRKKYSIRVLPDEPPRINIVQPRDVNYTLYNEKELELKSIISDDYGFSKLVLWYRSGNSVSAAGGNFNQIEIPIENKDATSLEVYYLWALNFRAKGLQTDYYLEVTDNSGKSAKSDLRKLMFAKSTEVLKRTESSTREIKSDLQAVLEEMKDLQKNINDIKKTQEENAINEQRKKDLQNKVENLQKNLENAQNKIDQTINDLKQNPNLNEKTLEQFMKLQELFQRINTPEFRDMLKKLQEAMKKNNEEMKRDLDNLKFDEEAFKKQLEQVMELMKQIENLQKMGELTQKLDEMTKAQEELRKETENTEKNNEGKMNTLGDKQKQIQENFNKLKEDMKKLTDNMKNTKGDMNPKDLEDLLKKMNQRKTEDKMNQSSKELFKQQKEQSEQTQKEISEDLEEFNEQMQSSLESAMSNMDTQNKMMDKLKQIKKNLEELSEKEQDLKDETNKLDKSDKDDFNDLAKDQGEIQQELSKNINDLMNATKDGMQISPELGKELGNSYNKMDKSGNDLKQGDKNSAMNNQGKAKESLDNAAKMLGDMLDKMGKQQGKGNKGDGKMGQLMQKLAEIIGQQQGVNGKMNKMGQDGQVGRDGKGGKEELSQMQKEQLDRLRIEQMEAQKSLEQLNEEFEREQQKTGEKLLGDLKEVEKEMQETVRQLSEYEIDEKLFERQNKILSRMLDARLSQREKDFEQKRESKPGDNFNRQSPREVVISGPRTENSLKEELLRLEKERFYEDYEKLIMEYNKLIKNR